MLSGAQLAATSAKFCIDAGKRGTTCWSFDVATSALRPLDPASALASPEPGAVTIAKDPEPPQSAWKATLSGDGITICHASDCKPFALPLMGNDDRQAISDVQVSFSGTRVAVQRGVEGVAKMSVDIYDRDTVKRLGTVKPKTQCLRVLGFAADVAVVNDWDCANQGGALRLVSPAGKQLAVLDGWYAFNVYWQQVTGDRWAFIQANDHTSVIDLASGKRISSQQLSGSVGFVGERQYVIDSERGRIRIFALDGKQLAEARAPTCRYEWETETIGGVTVGMTIDKLPKLVGAPLRKTKPDPQNLMRSTWTYANGLVLDIEASNMDPNTGAPTLPYEVEAITIVAPSTLRTGLGIGIGSTQAELEAKYGAHRVDKLSTPTKLVAGNAADQEGLEFELTDGKVSRIHL